MYHTIKSNDQTNQRPRILNDNVNVQMNISMSESVESSVVDYAVKGVPMAKNASGHARIKTILYYTKFFNLPKYGFGSGQEPFVEHCKVTNCQATPRKDFFKDMGDFDAAIFHLPNLLHPGKERSMSVSSYTLFMVLLISEPVLPPPFPGRRPHQRFVFFMREAPFVPHYYYYGKQAVSRNNLSYASLRGKACRNIGK